MANYLAEVENRYSCSYSSERLCVFLKCFTPTNTAGLFIDYKNNTVQIKTKDGVGRIQTSVFSVPCGDCGVHCIGETGQNFCDRRTQHQRDIKIGKTTNGFFHRIKENPAHKIDWDKVV